MANRSINLTGADPKVLLESLSIETINIVCIGTNFEYLYFNQAHKQTALQIWGIKVSPGANLLKTIQNSADCMVIKLNLDRAFTGKTTSETRTFGDQEKRLWECVYSPMYNIQGNIVGAIFYSIDVTTLKKVGTQIQEKNQKINYVFDNMTDGFALCQIICDKNNTPVDYKVLEVNKAYEAQCGIKAKDIVGKTVLEFFPDIEKSWIDIYGEVALTQKPRTFVNFNHNTARHYETSVYSPKKGQFALLFRDVEGSTQQLKSLEQEITKRKQVQKALKQSAAMFKALFEQTGGYCMILQPSASGIPVIIDANQAACDEHGYTYSELIGQPINKLIHEAEKTIKRRAQTIMAGKPLIIEAIHVRKDGSTFPVSVCANRIEIKGEPPLIFTVEHNISSIKNTEIKRKQAEDLSREHLAELAHVSRLDTIGEMATGIAHELTQPLSAINTFANAGLKIIEQGNHNTDLLTEALKGISKQALRAGDIIHQLRKYVQKESTQKLSADLNLLIRKVIRLLGPELKEKGIDLQLKLAAQLPTVTVNGIEVQQVLVNLIRNASDAIEENLTGLHQLTITSSLTEPSTITVTVTDTGIGMDQQTQDHIFEPFFSTKGNQGIGVGLSISHAIIQSHGGTFAAESQLGHGSSFRFTLPVDGPKN